MHILKTLHMIKTGQWHLKMRIAIIHFMDGWSKSNLSRSKDDGIPKIPLIPHLQWWILYP